MTSRFRWKLIRIVATFLTLTLFWLFFSASLSGFSLAAGLICSALIALVTYDVFIEDFEVGRRSVLPRFLPLLAFPFVLVAAMYASSFGVVLSIISGKAAPRVVHFRSRLRSDLARVVLAESITFTPGTMVIDLDEDHYLVHWLNATTRHSAKAGEEVKGGLEAAIRRIWA